MIDLDRYAPAIERYYEEHLHFQYFTVGSMMRALLSAVEGFGYDIISNEHVVPTAVQIAGLALAIAHRRA